MGHNVLCISGAQTAGKMRIHLRAFLFAFLSPICPSMGEDPRPIAPPAPPILAVTPLVLKQGNYDAQQTPTFLSARREDYARAILLDPASAIAHFNLGVLSEREQFWNDAIDYY